MHTSLMAAPKEVETDEKKEVKVVANDMSSYLARKKEEAFK